MARSLATSATPPQYATHSRFWPRTRRISASRKRFLPEGVLRHAPRPHATALDHAAENDYGVAAFNVNNMEQIQAIMEAAKETDSPVIVQASRGARSYSQDNYLRHLMLAAAELYPQIPIVMHQDHGNSPATCISAIENGFTSVMMDGSLKEDGKTPADYDYNVQRHARSGRSWPTAAACPSKGELGCLGSLEHGDGEQEDGHGADGQALARSVADRSRRGRAVRRRDRRRCPGRGHRHQPRGVQIHHEADRRSAGDGPHRGDSPAAAELPPGDARLSRACRRSCRTSSTSTAAR